MTDDAELRARIEAQVAARRAGGSSASDEPHPEPAREPASDAEPDRPQSGQRGNRPLAPRRPWADRSDDPARPAASPAAPPVPGGRLTPARPWAARADAGDELGTTAPLEPTSPRGRRGALTPARPWAGRQSAGSTERKAEPSAPAPSNPESVLRALAETDASGPAGQDTTPPPVPRRLLGRRETAQAVETDAEMAGREARLQEIARRAAPDAEALRAYAAAADQLDRRRRPAPAAEPDAEREPEQPAAALPAERQPTDDYPWQRREEVDLDLHGAPTWDPSQYPPEPEQAEPPRGRRALRWLLARAPEPEAVAPAGAPEPQPVEPAKAEPAQTDTAEVGTAPEAGTALEAGSDAVLEIELADQLGEAPVARPLAPEPADEPEPPPAATEHPDRTALPQTPRLSRWLAWRRPADEEDEEEGEAFRLPAPDQAFERPWLRATPQPTRDWSPPSIAPAEPVRREEPPAEVAEVPAPAAVPEPEPEPPAPTVEPDPTPEPEASPEPAAAAPTSVVPPVRPRPRPAPEPPAAAPTAQPSPAAPPRPSPRPKPAPAAAGWQGISSAAPRANPFERARTPRPAPTPTARRADFSRFLKASEQDTDDQEGDAERDGTRRRQPLRWRRWTLLGFVWLIILACAVLILRTYVVQPYYIPSESMEPTLHGCAGCTEDHVLVDKISYLMHDVRTGDIVVFHRPKGDPSPEKVLIKRVIALAGDTLQLKQGHVYVNGLLLPEDYVDKKCGSAPTQPLTSRSKWTVPSGDVFVMGDNRCHSDDSRVFGPIPTSSIVGRAFAIIWPLDRIGGL